jgi:uncharacterized membrane protein YqiK
MNATTVLIVVAVAAFVLLLAIAQSFHPVGPAQVGLVTKRIGRRLDADQLVALAGEAGYQAELLMPGLRFKLWPIYTVAKFPWVQVPAGEIGVVIAQVGRPLPIGAKSAEYRSEFGNFTDLAGFLAGGGEKGVQRPVLPPGSLVPIHPVAFLVITSREVFGLPVAVGLAEAAAVEALGVARAAGFGAQREAIGKLPTALVAMANAIAEGRVDIMPKVLVTGGGSLEGLAATLIRSLSNGKTQLGPVPVANAALEGADR